MGKLGSRSQVAEPEFEILWFQSLRFTSLLLWPADNEHVRWLWAWGGHGTTMEKGGSYAKAVLISFPQVSFLFCPGHLFAPIVLWIFLVVIHTNAFVRDTNAVNATEEVFSFYGYMPGGWASMGIVLLLWNLSSFVDHRELVPEGS